MTQEFFHPSEEDPRLHRIEAYLVRREFERAEVALLKLVTDDQDHAAAWLYLADLYLADNKWHKALDASRQIHRLFGADDPRPYVASGCARARLGRFHIALRDLQEADRLASGHPEVIRNIGWIKCMLGRLKEGRADLERSISIDPTNISTYVDLSMSFHFSGDYAKAKKWVRRALELDPENEFSKSQAQMILETEAEFKRLPPNKRTAKRKTLKDLQTRHDINIKIVMSSAATPPTIIDIIDIKEELTLGKYREAMHVPDATTEHIWDLQITS